MSLRSPLGRVLGNGSAKDGTGHWWAERVSSIALIPLTLWLLIALLLLPGLDYGTVRAWLSAPLSGFLMILALATLSYHSYLGTTVVAEDYLRGTTKVAMLLLLRFLHVLFGGAGIFAVLHAAFGTASP